jgi:hypothetical protein
LPQDCNIAAAGIVPDTERDVILLPPLRERG